MQTQSFQSWECSFVVTSTVHHMGHGGPTLWTSLTETECIANQQRFFCTDTFPNSDAKKFAHFVSFRTQPFLFQSETTLYLGNAQMLFFRMVCSRSFFVNVFIEKSPVYDERLSLSLLGDDSLIATHSQIFSLIATFKQNICRKPIIFRKNPF